MNIVFIGSGNVATQMAPALKENGHDILCVYSRSIKNAKALSTILGCNYCNKVQDIPSNADLYIVTLQDDFIEKIINQLNFQPACIVHTSGSKPLDIFPKRFMNTGVIYPLQTFTKNRKTNWATLPIFIEGNNSKSRAVLSKVAHSLSKNVQKANSLKRQQMHLAAVFANNFVNHLYSLSSELLKNEKISFDVLKPIILETTERILSADPAKIQTGPAKRKDFTTIKKHLNLLKADKNKLKVYKTITESIIHTTKSK